MNLFACILLLAAAQPLELLEETSTIQAGQWSFYPSMKLRQVPVTVHAEYTVLSPGKDETRLALLTHQDTERLFKDSPHGVVAATEPARQGTLRFCVQRPDDYDLLVDNRESRRDVKVRVRVWLEFGNVCKVVTTAAPARQFTVVLASFVFFFAVVSYSARRILRAVGRG